MRIEGTDVFGVRFTGWWTGRIEEDGAETRWHRTVVRRFDRNEYRWLKDIREITS